MGASGYGYAVWSTYGVTGVQGRHSCTVRTSTRRSDVRHDEDENFGDNYFVIIFNFNRDLVVRDQDEVLYIYATLMERI